MRTLTSFPRRFALVNEHVAELTLVHFLSADDVDAETRAEMEKWGRTEVYATCDLHMKLKDGRSYMFSAWTAPYIKDYIDREGLLSLVVSGLIIVRELTLEAILDALENCLEEEPLYGLGHFGIEYSDAEEV